MGLFEKRQLNAQLNTFEFNLYVCIVKTVYITPTARGSTLVVKIQRL